MWGRRADSVAQINAGSNEDYLPGIALPEGISATTDPQEALAGADIVVLAVPSQTLRANLAAWGHAARDAAVVSLMKGVELGTTKRMSEVIMEVGGVAPTASSSSPGPTWPRRSPASSRPPASSPAADQATADRVAAACHTATSGLTNLTSSGPSSVGR
jgi:glycerol-3-phosphate dehydrogenase (NAD(P)+)